MLDAYENMTFESFYIKITKTTVLQSQFSMSQLSISFHLAPGDHCRVQQEPRYQRRRRHRQVQGGQLQVSEAVWYAGGGEAGQLLLLQLLEGQGATTGMAVPQHQPPLLLLLLIRKRRLAISYLYVHEHSTTYMYNNYCMLISASFYPTLFLLLSSSKMGGLTWSKTITLRQQDFPCVLHVAHVTVLR